MPKTHRYYEVNDRRQGAVDSVNPFLENRSVQRRKLKKKDTETYVPKSEVVAHIRIPCGSLYRLNSMKLL